MKTKATQCAVLFVTSVGSTVAMAHMGHASGSGLIDGLLHPFGGVDHLVLAILVGLWAATESKHWKYLPLALFVICMCAGVTLAGAGVGFSMGQLVTGGSVLGAAVLLSGRADVNSASCTVVAAFALIHGQASFLAMVTLAPPLPYVLGLVLGSVVSLGIGFAAGVWLETRRIAWSLPAAGLVAGTFGAFFLLNAA